MSCAQPNPSDCCSSKPVDYDKIWAERLALTDAEVDCILSKAFYRDDDTDLLPPPPSPHDMEGMCNAMDIGHSHGILLIYIVFLFQTSFGSTRILPRIV